MRYPEWTLTRKSKGDRVEVKQDESQATYTHRRYPRDGEVNLNMSASEIDKLVRALTGPYPSAFIKLSNGEKIFLEKVSKG